MKRFINSLSAGRIILGISAVISMDIFFLLYGVSSFLGNRLDTQQMAERWSKEKDVAQVSCFFSPDAGISVDSIESFRHTLDAALKEASIVQDSPNAGARLWADAYSAEGKISVKSEKATVSADAIGIGGDFFLFHPLKLLYGAYFSGNDYNQDYCILDEDAAWQLFGSNDVAGMMVTIGGTPHVVAGVVHRDTGRLSKAAGLDSTVVYVSYSTLDTYGQNYGINHYEIVMPNPVSGYAYDYIQKHIGVSEKQLEVVENTGRYDLLNRFGVLADFGTRSMTVKAIIYPYWENVARGYEDIIAVLTLLAVLFFAYPVILLLILLVIYWKHKTWNARTIYLFLQDKWERKIEDVRAKRLRRKAHKDTFDDEEEYI